MLAALSVRTRVCALLFLAGFLTSACEESLTKHLAERKALSGAKVELLRIELDPVNVSLPKGVSRRFTATGIYSDDTTRDITEAVTWSAADNVVAALEKTGEAKGLFFAGNTGVTTISASLSGKSATATVTVTAATLASIGVTPANPSLAKGLTQQFAATGIFTDNSTQDLTDSVTWSSSDEAAGTISNEEGSKGLALAVNEGTTTVSATLNGKTGTSKLRVTAATLSSIAVTPANPSIPKGLALQLTATGTYSDHTTQDLTDAVNWSTSSSSTATVGNTDGTRGLAAGENAGSAVITAALSGKSGSVSLNVTAAELVSIGITPVNPSFAKGLAQQLTAMGTYTDHTTQDLTSAATWSSSNTSVATVSNADGSKGLVSSVGVGTTTITAAQGGKSTTSEITITAASLVSIGVTPPNPFISQGLTQQLTATGTYTDNSTQDLTEAVTWNSSNLSVATVSNADGSRGLVTGITTGNAAITAALSGKRGTSNLTVTSAILDSIRIIPENASVPKGLTQQFTAIGTYSDSSTLDLTEAVTWSSSDPSVAPISNADGSRGLATAMATGNTTITAVLNGKGGTTSLVVTPAVLGSLSITPSGSSIAKGFTQQFTATGTYSDGSTLDLTEAVTWSSSDSLVAPISNADGSRGLATGTGIGTVTISAILNGKTGTAPLSVTAATLVLLRLTPVDPSLAKGLAQQFVATGTYSDNTTQDLTNSATWSSSNSSAATVSNAEGSKGLATSLNTGSALISATLGGKKASSNLTVTPAVLASIAITPANPSITRKHALQLKATGVYTDRSTEDFTGTATWSSGDTAICTISDTTGTKGLATALNSLGSANISATQAGVTGTTLVTSAETVCGNNICEAVRYETSTSCPEDCALTQRTGARLSVTFPSVEVWFSCYGCSGREYVYNVSASCTGQALIGPEQCHVESCTAYASGSVEKSCGWDYYNNRPNYCTGSYYQSSTLTGANLCDPRLREDTTSVNTPIFTPPAGFVPLDQSVSIATSTGGSTIHFTTNGNEPRCSDATYTAPIPVSQNTTIKAIGCRVGMDDSTIATASYSIKADAPTFSPPAGVVGVGQAISLATTTSGARIYYTTDGNEPTCASAAYGAPIPIPENTTIKAIACKADGTLSPSVVAGASYTVNVSAPTFDPPGATLEIGQYVSLSSSTAGATIYYTVDGSAPMPSGTAYGSPIPVTANTVIRAMATRRNMNNSAMASATYTMNVSKPAFAPVAGVLRSGQTVAISTSISNAAIHYRTDGANPTCADATFSAPIPITQNTFIRALACRSGFSSNTGSGLYRIPSRLAAGYRSSLVIRSDNTLWGFGDNYYGQLGDGTRTGRRTPGQLLTDVASVAGCMHTLVLKQDGTLWAFGNDYDGQLGDGANSTRLSPVQILNGVATMATGTDHSLAVKQDGTLWSFGRNYDGQLGDGSGTSKTSPVQVMTEVASAAAGARHSLALKRDGTLWAFGANSNGELGDGTTTPKSRPVQVLVNGVIGIASGLGHSLALKQDGTLWAFGANSSGQLGDGTTTSRSTPVQVMSGVLSVAAGYSHSLVLKRDGTLWVFGNNGNGQLGDGTGVNKTSPVQIMSGVAGMAAGMDHSLVLKQDNTVWAFGDNYTGQLGDGTTEDRLSPVQVSF